MGLFGKTWAEQKIEALESSMQELTSHILKTRDETANLHAWINWLYAENLKQQQTMQEMAAKLRNAPLSKDEIKELIDSHYAFDNILAKIRQIEEKINLVVAAKSLAQPTQLSQLPLPTVHYPVFEPQKPMSMLKEQLVKRLVRNSKDYIKSAMLSLIKKYGKLTAIQLRDIIVDEQALCSKSSFYRILEELEAEGQLSGIEQGREKSYITRLTKNA